MKITAICGGGDWCDASVDHVILPEHMDFEAERKKREAWYRREYLPALRAGKRIEYISLIEWLKRRGATVPAPEQLEVVWG